MNFTSTVVSVISIVIILIALQLILAPLPRLGIPRPIAPVSTATNAVIPNPVGTSTPPALATSPYPYTVVAIDMNDDGLISEKSVLAGDDAILAYEIPTGSLPLETLYYFNTLASLSQLDAEKNGRIDSSDVGFQNLRLLSFSKHGAKTFLAPMSVVGIRAIFLDKDSLKTAEGRPEIGFDAVAYEVILPDGSKHRLGVIAIDPKYLRP